MISPGIPQDLYNLLIYWLFNHNYPQFSFSVPGGRSSCRHSSSLAFRYFNLIKSAKEGEAGWPAPGSWLLTPLFNEKFKFNLLEWPARIACRLGLGGLRLGASSNPDSHTHCSYAPCDGLHWTQRENLLTLIAGHDDRPNSRWNQGQEANHEGQNHICMTQECVRTGKPMREIPPANGRGFGGQKSSS